MRRRASPFLTSRTRDVWAPVAGWPYWVSTTGKVRSAPREVLARDGRMMRLQPRILKPQCNHATGYPCIRLNNNLRARTTSIHELVAEAFIGQRPPRHVVNHIDGNKTNYFVGNLEYVTRSENARHARDSGLAHRKLSVQDVNAIRHQLAHGATRKEIAEQYGITTAMVGRIDRRDSWN